MYNSCKEAHIAVSEKIQQINANRQESIRPQYIDIALNEAIDILVTQKCKLFEETGRLYDDLRVLKATEESPLYLDTDIRGFSYLPLNYLKGVSYSANVIYDKFKKYRTKKEIGFKLALINLDSLFETLPMVKEFSITIGILTYTIKYPAKIYDKEGIFECINYILNKLRVYGVSASYEQYDGEFYVNTLILKLPLDTQISTTINNSLQEKSCLYEAYSGQYMEITSLGEITKTKESKVAGLDLVSDVQRMDMIQTYHNAKNRHIHPICTIENNKLYVDMNDDFIITNIKITYLRKPTYYNFLDNTATELPFTTEIINLAVQRLLGTLKDNGYQIQVNENNLLK